MQERHTLTRESFGILGAVAVVGTVVGLVSGALRMSADWLAHWLDVASRLGPADGSASWLIRALLGAVAVALAAWLASRFAPEAAGSGVQEIEGALSGARPIHWRRLLPVKFAGAWLALGSGLALGREGPTVQMGGNIGAMLSDWVRLSDRSRHVLIASGAAAGLAAAFNAPLAGVMFVVEEMRPQFHFGFLSFQSVLLAAVCADVVTQALFGGGLMIETPPLPDVRLGALWAVTLYGALIGGVGVVFARSLVMGLDLLERVGPRGRLVFAAAMGAIVGAATAWDTSVTGGGYQIIHTALDANLTLVGLLVLFFVRFGMTVGSYATGVPGGIFAPMLALGVLLGVAFGVALDALVPGLVQHPGIFAVAGMAAFFAATVRAPITGIALAIEMTGDLGQLLPLLVTCLAATVAAELLGGRPIYEVLLERTLARADAPTPS